MSFDKDTRNLLAKTVAACRRRLIEDVTHQLRGVFGLHPDGTVLPLDKLTHLSPDQHAAARHMRDLLDHYTAGTTGKDSDRRKAAYERMVLEISFTVLNRLAALRLCEERGLVIECVRKGTTSAGFQMFERISGGALGGRYDTYRVFLECLFDELALDLGVLFERMTPQSAVFPSERCLEDVLAELNKPELTHLWIEDETIGWIYQYFNPPEERKAMREASQAPRNSRELAVRNQFFTPRYVVEFLTDNTLGRIWYEMRKGDTALKDECRYLIRRPNEVFLTLGEQAPPSAETDEDQSQEELLKQPVYIEYRPKKDPRDLRVLDPPCGSGHFLLYAFDLLERIYEEAWRDPESPKSEITGRTLREDYEALDELRREAPKLIIEHNLHGIDIDPRAVQIAALALWLRAQKAWKTLGLKASERPRIKRSNIVTAEPMPGEEDMRREFTAGLKPRVLGQLVDVVFEKMKLAGEAGSLLKIEEEIKDAVAQARKQWLEGPKPEQQFLFPGMAVRRPEQQELRFDVTEITEERFWEQAEDLILAALKNYAEQAENGRAVRRRLFAEDAARGFAFIDLCRKRYDVVLMNPPFGEFIESTNRYVSLAYPDTFIDFFACFVERGALLSENGSVGAITPRAFLLTKTLERWRIRRIIPETCLLMDMGFGVLDGSTVETCAYVLQQSRHRLTSHIFDLRRCEGDYQRGLENVLIDDAGCGRRYIVKAALFLSIPRARFLYHLDSQFLDSLLRGGRFDPHGGTAKNGLQTYGDERFLRLIWEIDPTDFGRGKRWVPISKGGDFETFFFPVHLAMNYEDDGKECGAVNAADNGQVAQTRRNSEYYYKESLTYPSKSTRGFSVRQLHRDCLFALKGPIIAPKDSGQLRYLLGWANSSLVRGLVTSQASTGEYLAGIIQAFPWMEPARSQIEEVARAAVEVLELKRRLYATIETDALFTHLLMPAAGRGSIAGIVVQVGGTIHDYETKIRTRTQLIDTVVAEVYSSGEIEQQAWELATDDHAIQIGGELQSPDFWSKAAVSYAIGCVFGRWDIRAALEPLLTPKLPDPFDPLPGCPPGMLAGLDGLPAKPGGIVSEEWLRRRQCINGQWTVDSKEGEDWPLTTDHYPLRISWDGILVDDPGGVSGQWVVGSGQPHKDDILRRVREVLDLLWKDKAHEIEQETCDILGVSDLRDYFQRPAGFFQDHLKRYSKSRRKAPIYWPLSTTSGSYTLWLYYHRLTDQTLYVGVNKYVEPKIAEVQRVVDSYQCSVEAREKGQPDAQHPDHRSLTTSQLRKRWEEARAFLGELRDLREELLRIAALPFKPDLNDSVIINAAPFHTLFRLRSWANDTEQIWQKLEKGYYDWAHLAYTIWPDRVREVCKRDRSIAIAHGLEDLWEIEVPESKKKGGRGRRKKEAA